MGNIMKTEVSQHAGFCFGVDRAVNICGGMEQVDTAEEVLTLSEEIAEDTPRPLHMLGSLVHNETVVDRLKERGIKVVKSLDEIDEGTVIITAHGIYPEIYEQAKEKGLYIVDTTCPRVIAVHKLARSLQKDGREVIIVGDEDHIEVKGINGSISWSGKVVATLEEAEALEIFPEAKIGVVSQTTQDEQRFADIVEVLERRSKDVEVRNTICESTKGHQREAKELASRHDIMLVIGSKTSGNTKRLYELCSSLCQNTHWIDSAEDLQPEWFEKGKSMGITAGASTPKELITEVEKRVEEITQP